MLLKFCLFFGVVLDADKVYRELFHSDTSALLVDSDGAEWDCVVLAETRNDLRLQYTLRVRHPACASANKCCLSLGSIILANF